MCTKQSSTYSSFFNSSPQSKSRNNTKNALGVVDKVSGALLKQLAAGDKPKSISSPNLDMSVGRKTLDSIGGADDDEDAEEGDGMGGVRLPDPLALFGGANASVEEGATSAIGSTVSEDFKFSTRTVTPAVSTSNTKQ